MKTRVIRPSFWTNDKLGDCTPLARLFFIGLWSYADREGRFEIREKKLRAEIFPYDSVNVAELLGELQTQGFIETWTIEGKNYAEIINFKKHQSIHKNEASSTVPDKPTSQKLIDIPCNVAECSETLSNSLPHKECQVSISISKSSSKSISKGEAEGEVPMPTEVEVHRFVWMTPDEKRKLVDKYGLSQTNSGIEILSAWIGGKAGQLAWFKKKYSSAYNVLHPKTSWVWRELAERSPQTKSKRQIQLDNWYANAMADVEAETEALSFFDTLAIEGR